MRASASIVLTTFDQPNALRLALLGYSIQTTQDFEIVVADDGSDAATKKVIDEFRQQTKLDVKHVWQPNKGFRKCRVLNRAVLVCTGDYLIFSDGDCIPRHDFVETHLAASKPGHYLSGGYVKLSQKASRAINDAVVLTGDFARRGWLRQHGLRRWENVSKLSARGRVAQVLNRVSLTRAGWHGHNASCWRDDAIRVNGFDERMGWGGEDREFGYRLVNSGVRARRIRYSAICVHLYHDRPWRDSNVLQKNDALRAETQLGRATKTPCGITQLTR